MVEKIFRYKRTLYYIFLLLISLNLYSTSTIGKGLHRIALDILGYPVAQIHRVVLKTKKLHEKYQHLLKALDENQMLKKKLAQLTHEKTRLEALLSEMESFAPELKRLRRSNVHIKSICRIVGEVRNSAVFIIDCGEKESVQPGDPVLSPEGIVGKVSNTGRYFSTVITIFNPELAVDAITVDSRSRGIVKGGKDALTMLYIMPSATIAIGDNVVTSGLDGTFPYGIPVGQVEKVLLDRQKVMKQVVLKPATTMNALTAVIVLKRRSP